MTSTSTTRALSLFALLLQIYGSTRVFYHAAADGALHGSRIAIVTLLALPFAAGPTRELLLDALWPAVAAAAALTLAVTMAAATTLVRPTSDRLLSIWVVAAGVAVAAGSVIVFTVRGATAPPQVGIVSESPAIGLFFLGATLLTGFMAALSARRVTG